MSAVVTICTASLTFSNCTFCPHTVFVCFVWIWEQTAIISLYSIDWLVFITETESVYCAVRAELLNVIQVNLQPVPVLFSPPHTSHPPTRLLPHVSVCEVFGGPSGIWIGYSPSSCSFSCRYHSTSVPYFICTFWNLGTFLTAVLIRTSGGSG